jgi:hypothetical protein
VEWADVSGDGLADVITGGYFSLSVFLGQQTTSTLALYRDGVEVASATSGQGDLSVLLSGFVADVSGIYTLGVSTAAEPRGYSLLVARGDASLLAPEGAAPAAPATTQRLEALAGDLAIVAFDDDNAGYIGDPVHAVASAPLSLAAWPYLEPDDPGKSSALHKSKLEKRLHDHQTHDLALSAVMSELAGIPQMVAGPGTSPVRPMPRRRR